LGHEQFLIRVSINHICRQLGFELSATPAAQP
jgi:hypothetical protein